VRPEDAWVPQASGFPGIEAKGIVPRSVREHVGEANSRLPTFVLLAVAEIGIVFVVARTWSGGCEARRRRCCRPWLADILAPTSQYVGAGFAGKRFGLGTPQSRPALSSPGQSRSGRVRLASVVSFLWH